MKCERVVHAGDWLAEIALWVQWRQGWQERVSLADIFFPTDGLQVASDGISDCIGMEGPRLVGTVELYLPRLPVMRVHPVDGSWSNVAVKSHKDIMYDYTIILYSNTNIIIYYIYDIFM